ncbi:MAG: carbohydrate ABC transporter permease, partial [Thermotoga sp.]
MVKKITFYTLLSIMGFFSVFPLLWMVATSFNSSGAIFKVPPTIIPDMLFKHGMWSNYVSIFKDYNFGRFTLNSTIVAFGAAIGQLITCSMAAFAFAKMQFKGKEILFGLLLATMMIPLEVTIIPEFLIMFKLHWLNTYLPLIVPSFLVGSFGTFLLREFFENVPDDLIDAAVIDGANSFAIYRKIFLPLAKTPLTALFLIAFMNNWNALLRPVLYIDKESLFTLTIGLTNFQSQYESQWNLLLSGSVVSILPLII